MRTLSRGFEMIRLFLFMPFLVALAACSSPGDPSVDGPPAPSHDGSLRIAALDYQVGDLTDQEVLAKYTRADIVIFQCDQFWGHDGFEGRLDLLRAAKPDIKIIGYFRSKVVKPVWETQSNEYNRALLEASRPYWCATTTGDTAMDWPGAVLFDYTDPDARRAMLDVFLDYQRTSSNKFDGMYWDYFNDKLWIAPAVTGMDGEPDMDGDGVGHFEDEDERQAFMDAQYDWVSKVRKELGNGFIQIANGSRALTDSVFAGQFDGMFYELFPNVGYGAGDTFRKALDPNQYNNLFTAVEWPRTNNGGPWLILSHAANVGSYQTPEGTWATINPGDLLRAVALLTGATSTHYDLSGAHRSGLPGLELDLGAPVEQVRIVGNRFSRHYENGRVELEMGVGYYPKPFAYGIPQHGEIIEQFGEIAIDP